MYCLDEFSGTGTAAALYTLRRCKRSRAILIDNGHSIEYVKQWIPRKYHHRVLYIQRDINTLCADSIMELVRQRWPDAAWDKFVHIHASPSCRSHSRADRGLSKHRGSAGQPLTELAKSDDKSCAHAIGIMQDIRRIAKNALFTIENPESRTFLLQPCIKQLMQDSDWQVLQCSYCKCAHPMLDKGFWPRKDTFVIAAGLPPQTSLPQCDNDCEHLVDRVVQGQARRHKVVICRSSRNWPEQVVITDPMIKGLIPHGLFNILHSAHSKWLAQQPAQAHFGSCISTHPQELAQAVAQVYATQSGKADGSADDGGILDEDAMVDEADYGKDGLRKQQSKLVREEVPTYRTRDVQMHELFRFLPEHWRKYGALDTFEPWTIMFADNITIPHGKGIPDTKLLVVYDVATAGLRIKPYEHKHELGELMDEVIVEEALNKRSARVTVGADGDGAMALVRETCRKRGVSWLPLPPWQPHLNPVELAVSHLKACTASALLGACTEDGPITPKLAHHAAQHVAYVNERFAATRRTETYRGEHYSFSSPWKLNTGVEPSLERLVPWGQPGYAYVPEELRKARGAPKYLRAEPVLLLGYQFMYTGVYKVLTRHNTVIHTEQVLWCMDMPKGIFPPVGGEKQVRNALARLSLDDVIPGFKDSIAGQAGKDVAEKAQKSAATDSAGLKATSDCGKDQPLGARTVLRLNVDKVTTGKGPAPYILARCEALDGVPYENATGTRYLDARGKSRPYSKQDLNYDISCGWLRVDIVTADGKVLIANDTGLEYRASGRWGHHQYACLVASLGAAHSDMGKLSNELSALAFLAMRDMTWSKYLHGPDHDAIMSAYNKEWDSLCSSVLREIYAGDKDYEQAKQLATRGRMLLEFKRVGIWKARVVVRGDLEDRERLDGPDFNYAANVCEFTAVRNMLFDPRSNPSKAGKDDDPIVVASADIAVAFTQAEKFRPDEAKRYLTVFDPVLQEWRYFEQTGNLYGSGSAGARWEKTLVAFMTSEGVGFVQGKNELCAFLHKQYGIAILSYCDDLLVRGPRSKVKWFFDKLAQRFQIKPPVYLSKDSMLDHLGMVIFETDEGTYISMQSYIEVMCQKLDIDIERYEKKPRRVP